MLKLNGSGEFFIKNDGTQCVFLISENKVWELNSSGYICYCNTEASYNGTDNWKTTTADYLAGSNTDIFDTLARHAFLWPEYQYLMDEEDCDW